MKKTAEEHDVFEWMQQKGYDRKASKDIAPIIVKYLEEYRSQASELPSDDEIETYEHDVTNKYGESMSNHQTDDGFAAWEIGMKQMRSIASPLIASHVARILELEECLTSIKEKIQLNGETVRTAPDGEYKDGYLQAITNVIAIIDEKITPPKP